MRQPLVRKQKIELSDYNYLRDINNRLVMAGLATFEVEVLKEVLDTSLKFPISHLAEDLDSTEELVLAALTKLSQTGLLSIQGKTVIVDKEMRKYYETQVVKFDDRFEPGMDFLQGLLNKVPIHHLPTWYAISRISDHIFQSIVEKYLQTPRIYKRYLQDLEFDDPLLHKIIQDVFTARDFKVPSEVLINKYKLSPEEFEKKMLLLEYSFACCITYERVNEQWQEVVTPFHEWKEYLLFLQNTYPQPIKEESSIERFHESDFGFIEDMAAFFQTLPVKESAAEKHVKHLLPHAKSSPSYAQRLIAKAKLLDLVETNASSLCLTEQGNKWLLQCKQDQAHLVYCLPTFVEENSARFGDRDVRELEKGLKQVAKAGWIEFSSFLANLTAQIGTAEPVTLKNKGKRWRYALPSYSTEEKEFIQTLLCGKFFDSGMVAIGLQNESLCFYVTPFGRMLLES